MQLSQAIVSSSITQANDNNKIIARSEGIDDAVAQQLCEWSPRANELVKGAPESLNVFEVDSNFIAIARSTFGAGKSESETCQILTRIVLVERDQLAGYQHNPIFLARVLQSTGLLTLMTSKGMKLPLLELADSGFPDLRMIGHPQYLELNESILHAIKVHHRVVMFGLSDPCKFMGGFLAALPEQERTKTSFSTGLQVIDNRPFQLQFFSDTSRDTVSEIARRQIRTIKLPHESTLCAYAPVAIPVATSPSQR